MFKFLSVTLLFPAALLSGCRTVSTSVKTEFSHFVGIDDFSNSSRSQNERGETERGETILLSPEIKPGIPWNELIVSWNAEAPPGTFLKVEASAVSAGRATKFYDLGNWSPDNEAFPRVSLGYQKDADGSVLTDTLALTHPADAVRIRVTLGGIDGARPRLNLKTAVE